MLTRDETRQRILDAAAAVFARFGPAKTSIADVARELHMSPANIYNFFASKEALFEELGATHFRAFEQTLRALLAEAADPWAAIRTVFIEISRDIRERIGDVRDMIQLPIATSKHDWKFVKTFHAFIIAALEELIRQLIHERGLAGIDPATAAVALFDCMIIATDPWLIMKFAPEEHARRLHAQLQLLERAFSQPSVRTALESPPS